MARGPSGRIVLEVEPSLKQAIYAQLDRRGITLKEWFLATVELELAAGTQLELDLAAAEPAENKKVEKTFATSGS